MIETGHIQNSLSAGGLVPPETFPLASTSVEFAFYLREAPVQAARQKPSKPLNQAVSPCPYPSKAISTPPSEADAAAAYRKQEAPGELTDLGSAFSFGLWRPDGEAEPEGFLERAGFFLSKMKEAIFGDLIQGASGSAIRAGENVVLAGWNLLEVVPDATLGNWDEGRKLTTTFFDNGQVIIDYMTDIIPTGEAWLRVHALNLEDIKDPKAPVWYNIEMPERFEGDVRWSRVRNTPFRKTIETIGALLADIAAVKVIGDMNWSSERKHE